MIIFAVCIYAKVNNDVYTFLRDRHRISKLSSFKRRYSKWATFEVQTFQCWTFKHSLIAIIHHAFSDKTIIVWSFLNPLLCFLSKTFFSSKILSELWIGNKRNVAFIFEKHAQFSTQNEGIFEFWRPKYNCVARKIWKCICRKFEIRASLPFATGIRDFPRREQVGK